LKKKRVEERAPLILLNVRIVSENVKENSIVNKRNRIKVVLTPIQLLASLNMKLIVAFVLYLSFVLSRFLRETDAK